MIRIKRENWKGRGYVVVARETGRRGFLSYAKWNNKFTVPQAQRIFKRNSTFNKDVSLTQREKTVQVNDFSERPAFRRTEKFQGLAEVSVRFGNRIVTEEGTSKQRNIGDSIEEAKEEALENAKGRAVQSLGLASGSGEDELIDALEDASLISQKTGVVYYRERRMAHT